MWFSKSHYSLTDPPHGLDNISLAKEEFSVAMTEVDPIGWTGIANQ